MKNVVLFRHHDLFNITLRHLDKLESECNYDVWSVYDSTDRAPFLSNSHRHFNFSIEDYKQSGFPLASDKLINQLPTPPKIGQSRAIYYNPEYANILFKKYVDSLGIDYDYFWYIEYDVCFNGNWQYFFDRCKYNTADFLGIHLRKYPDEAGFAKFWSTFNWDVNKDNYYGAYGTINRYSRKALGCLESQYLDGRHGFYETIVPTLLKVSGLRLADINMCDWFYATSTMNGGNHVEEWTADGFASTNNMLYHPVKKDYRSLGFKH